MRTGEERETENEAEEEEEQKTVFRVTGVMKVKGQRFWDKHQPLS